MRSTLGAALVIGRRIMRQRLRDRSALLFAVVTPLGLAHAFSILIPNDFQAFHTHFVIVDLDGGPSASHLADEAFGAIASAGVADVSRAATEDEARAILDAGDAGAVVVIPAGFSQAIASGTPTQVRLLGGEFPASFEVARSVMTRFAAEAGAAQLLIATALDAGGPELVTQASAMLSAPPPIAVIDAVPPARQASLATFYAAAMAIMFVFFATQYGALAIHADRQTGTLSRHLAAPLTAGAILLGGTIASLVLGLLAMTVLVLGSSLLAHATWGAGPLVAVLLFAGVFAASGISMLVSTVAQTPQQAGILNSIVALSLAAIGGVFLPLSQAPQSIVVLSQITPHAWFLRAIDTLADQSAGLADILPSLAVLMAMGAVTGGIGLLRARKALAMR
jgi:ABC-2 type transport system permease protein